MDKQKTPRRTKLGGNIPPTRETLGGTKKATPIKEIEEEDEDETVTEETDQQKMLQLSLDLEHMKRDQHNMIAKQHFNYGATIDMVNSLQSEIDQSKAENSGLITEMKAEKERYDKLENNLDELQRKFESYQKTLKSLKRESEVYENSKELLEQTKDKCTRIERSNRHLRALLMKHHINPDIDAKDMGNSKHVRKVQIDRKPINAVSPGTRVLVSNFLWR